MEMEINGAAPCSVHYSRQFYAQSWNNDATEKKNVTVPSKVHVNPNFRNGKSLVIHVNPRMRQNGKIHVNPKMMKDVVPVASESTKEDFLLGDNSIVKEKQIQKSIHVNPKLVKKLSSARVNGIENNSVRSKPISADRVPTSLPDMCKIYRNAVVSNKNCIKNASPRSLSISRRKLVRSNGKTSSSSRVVDKKSTNISTLTKFHPIENKYKTSMYKIDRTTAVERRKRKKLRTPDARIRNVNKGLVAIGGVMYQSSRTRLVRSDTSSSPHKKKNCATGTKNDTFVMAKNGKKLHRLCAEQQGPNAMTYVISRNSLNRRTVVKRVPNSIVQTSHKNVLSYKAKQRSLQILRDKLRKNYVPCLLYRRFGYCAKHAKGTCPKLHDKKQVALCKNFLQGECLLDECPLSHDIGPEKMPTCKYFLEGCCIRDACPYLHVKVSPNTPLCAQFLRGYCADGNKCKQRHAYICPEFEKSGNCPKGKYCPYPHKFKSSVALATKTSLAKTARTSTSSKRFINNNLPSKIVPRLEDSRKRYYDSEASSSDKRNNETSQSIIKESKFINENPNYVENSDKTFENSVETMIIDDDETDRDDDQRPKRPPIGPLPAYIPIN